jgi:hypothetical protein
MISANQCAVRASAVVSAAEIISTSASPRHHTRPAATVTGSAEDLSARANRPPARPRNGAQAAAPKGTQPVVVLVCACRARVSAADGRAPDIEQRLVEAQAVAGERHARCIAPPPEA